MTTFDKPFWTALMEADWVVPDGHTVADLTPKLLDLLAHPDPFLRDDIGYMAFVAWIERDKHYSHDELHTLIDTLTANLRDGLGEVDTDAVLKRSFSALVLSVVTHYALTEPFLSEQDIDGLLNKLIAYLTAEKDLRGYEEPNGWHHAVAHTADVFKFLARNANSTASQHERILNATFDKLSAAEGTIYVHAEDERLVWAVFDVMRRNLLAAEQWQAWLKRFSAWADAHKDANTYHGKQHVPYTNLKTFIRSMFFTVDAIVDEGENLGEVHELAKTLLPTVKATARTFGKGTIYAG